MNNIQSFIASEFDNVFNPILSRQGFKPDIVISHGLAKTKHIGITWQQLEHIKQYLIDSEKGE